MNNYRQLAPAGYLIAFLLFFIPFFDTSMSLAPWSLGNSQWRFGAFGLMSNALMLPATGALIGVAAAISAGHVRVLRVLSIIFWLMVAVIVVGMLLFALDTLQARRMIRADMALSYYVASATAMGKLVLGLVSFVLLARGSRLDASATIATTAPIRVFGKRDF